MSELALQNVIAKLCVDRNFRRSFLTQADETLKEFNLTEQEVESLKAIDMEAIKDYAGSLVGKRMAIISKWMELPLSFLESRTSHARVDHILNKYGVEEIRNSGELGGDWVRSECQRFSEYLHSLVKAKEIEVPGFEDLVDYQSLKFLMMMDPEVSQSAADFEAAKIADLSLSEEKHQQLRPLLGCHARVKEFKHDLAPVIDQLLANEPVGELEEGPSWALFYKKTRKPDLDVSFISLPLKQMIEMLNGERAIKDIIKNFVSQYLSSEINEQDLVDDCLSVLQGFYEAGIIKFISDDAH